MNKRAQILVNNNQIKPIQVINVDIIINRTKTIWQIKERSIVVI